MGLWVSHDCWGASYSTFSRFRDALWAAAGGETINVELFPGVMRPEPKLDWDAITDRNLEGEWAETPADPLIVLIAHSDCSGVIDPAQAGPLAARLEELAPKLDAGPPGLGGGYREAALRFARGLRDAAEKGEIVEFS